MPIATWAQPAPVASGRAGQSAAAGALPGEPVTREYERYAQNDLTTPSQPSGYLPFPTPSDTPEAPTANPFRPTALPPPPGSLAPAPVQTAQIGSGPNPFGGTSAPTLDEPGGSGLGSSRIGSARAPLDPLTADIDRSIELVSADVAPRLDGTISLRGRSGDNGLGGLFDIEAPIEASFSPNGYGRLKVQVNPVYLYSGTQSTASRAVFGTNPIPAAANAANTISSASTGIPVTSLPVLASRTRSAVGAGLNVSYAYDLVTADIGASPLGFQQSNVVGGLQLTPKLASNITLRLTAERRAVTDSLLSYAGQQDARTGERFGGVTRNRAYAQLEGSTGGIYYYAGAGFAVLAGHNVKTNTEVEAGAGVSIPVWMTPTQEIRVGTNLIYLGYQRNLDNFTIGQGGYFSPQQYFAALFPVTYRQQVTPDLSYLVGGSIGVQAFRTRSEQIFPSDSGLQSQLSAISGAATSFGGGHVLGPAGGARAELDYRVNDNLHVGAKAGFDRSGNFTEGTGLVYARYVFNDPPQ